ncbi:PAS domain-containing sensor histidine kinase [Deinococcus aerophilus]|uniref:histidine kinase n=1 Tax=Deinococcus aerophilus TaxID=522488 RepID=A0ABQ2GZZ7_9DEIO|nr:ATP-binding protein [Deinococcus aerophilus]GGM19872.1 hypothetical protein GCM10010841_29860 [Deinococcus aerophilus]
MTDTGSDLHPGELQAIMDDSSDCIKVLDLDGRLLSMNAGGMQVMEIEDFSSCQHAPWPTFWEGEGRALVEQAVEAARGGQTRTFEGLARTFAGTPRWWEVRVSPVRTPDGEITRLLAVSRDITVRRTLEQELRDTQRQLRERAETLEVQVGQHERALAAFVRFTTQVASSTDLKELGEAAGEIIRDAVGGAMSGLYLVRGDTAYPAAFSSNTPPEVRQARQAGVPLNSPLVAEALARRGTAFVQGDDGRLQSVGYASALSVTAFHARGRPYALFATGTGRPAWTAHEQAIIGSVGQGLGLALERAQQTHQLQERTAGLDAFVAFSEASGVSTDLLDLSRRAVEVLQATLADTVAAYLEPDGPRWKAQVWSDPLTPEEAADLAAGVATQPVGGLQVVESGPEPGANGAFGTRAFYPCVVGGTLRGLLATGTRRTDDWTPRKQAVFSAVGRSLTLALERAAQAQALTAQRDALDLRTQELQAANEELEAFTYSASHDLRTPIRHVMGFADMAARALDRGQPDKVIHALSVVRQGATRMEQLIDGMLMLSRAGRQDFRPRMVALELLIAQAYRDARQEFPAQVVELRAPPATSVWGDATLLQQVLSNLISNAVKYSSTRETSEIEVRVEEHDGAWQISVHDNGVGFDPRHAGKLFGIFQRLHPQDAFPGSGVGLATVRRIVLKHGGQVFAHAQEGRGATFGFTLSKPPVP